MPPSTLGVALLERVEVGRGGGGGGGGGGDAWLGKTCLQIMLKLYHFLILNPKILVNKGFSMNFKTDLRRCKCPIYLIVYSFFNRLMVP